MTGQPCVLSIADYIYMKQQQLFYDPLIQDNQGEPLPETVRHINPHYHHYPPQYL